MEAPISSDVQKQCTTLDYIGCCGVARALPKLHRLDSFAPNAQALCASSSVEGSCCTRLAYDGADFLEHARASIFFPSRAGGRMWGRSQKKAVFVEWHYVSPPHRLPEPPLASRWHFATVPPQRRPPDSPRALRPAGTAAGTTGFFCFLGGTADPRNHDSARTHASVQVLFWSSIVDRSEGRLAATQSEERLMLPCRLACWRWLHWPRAWCTALVSSLD